ncbi:ATP-binding protein [Pseudonocardia sp. N23]|uniref:ATP-binding protein n=1 Tax=Pseudonocardia sp. N23 TaxID=1987376 RepID=UPI000BFDFC03|nr:ATP-binding protein [Pseudonocardia sp. N23]GAY09120.1 hypothetical protein TOK_3076 [Pseudonocardia sp. N23]
MGSVEPFVGRSAELAVLTGELDRARSGEPSVVVAAGQAGIGRTTMLQRLATAGRVATVLHATGAPEEVAVLAQAQGDPAGMVAALAPGSPTTRSAVPSTGSGCCRGGRCSSRP